MENRGTCVKRMPPTAGIFVRHHTIRYMDVKSSAIRTYRTFLQIIPQILGIVLLISLALTLIPPEMYETVFTGNPVADPFVGATIGSVAAGNPVTSYVIGGELLNFGVSLTAVTAFIIAWVTVGLIQLPVEMNTLGSRFAITRNLCGFLFAVIIAVLTQATLTLMGVGV